MPVNVFIFAEVRNQKGLWMVISLHKIAFLFLPKTSDFCFQVNLTLCCNPTVLKRILGSNSLPKQEFYSLMPNKHFSFYVAFKCFHFSFLTLNFPLCGCLWGTVSGIVWLCFNLLFQSMHASKRSQRVYISIIPSVNNLCTWISVMQ